jgi:hypothetical protein
MKLQLTSYKKIYTIETEHDDLDIREYLNIMRGLLTQSGFTEKTVDEGIIELANTLTFE